jgi:phosphoribosylaminoimidazolecarboxamide formyltransferase/IMP cyclohydrolase
VQADAVSAFGGIVAFNKTIDKELAREIREFRFGASDHKHSHAL